MDGKSQEKTLKDTLTMPKGTFPMRANLAQKEPRLLEMSSRNF